MKGLARFFLISSPIRQLISVCCICLSYRVLPFFNKKNREIITEIYSNIKKNEYICKGKHNRGFIMEKIDTLDKKILEIVMNNARIPSKDVAQVCGVSRAAVHQRIQRLIDDGVITGSGYKVNPKMLGYSTCTFIGLTLERGSMYRTVVPELLKIKEVVECHFTTGHYTMMIKVYARDNEHLMSLVNDRIQHIDGVAATETLISLEQSISRTLPIYYDE